MARYKVILAYDGTEFSGFQRQAGGRTVQDVVEEALRRIGWQDRVILAAGRTDTGVHARGQVIAFDLDWHHSPADLQRAINANLPADVAAREVHQADA
ncbi:MAG: tRNA pseudouridine(38-40) synthase TruA, partial [Chloroflexota bacterium]